MIWGFSDTLLASKDIYPQGIRKLWLKTELFHYLKFVHKNVRLHTFRQGLHISLCYKFAQYTNVNVLHWNKNHLMVIIILYI